MVRQRCFSLQMIVIGVIVWLSFYENCYCWEIGSSNVLTKTEIDFIVRYLATAKLHLFIPFYYAPPLIGGGIKRYFCLTSV